MFEEFLYVIYSGLFNIIFLYPIYSFIFVRQLKSNKIIRNNLFNLCYMLTCMLLTNIFKHTIVSQSILLLTLIIGVWTKEKSLYIKKIKSNTKLTFSKLCLFIIAVILIKYSLDNLMIILQVFMKNLGIPFCEQSINVNIMNSNTYFEKILYVIAVSITGPILEEFSFRVYWYDLILKPNSNKIVGMLISSLLFASVHEGVISMISSFIIGIVFCIIYDKYGYKWTIIAHSICNLYTTYKILF